MNSRPLLQDLLGPSFFFRRENKKCHVTIVTVSNTVGLGSIHSPTVFKFTRCSLRFGRHLRFFDAMELMRVEVHAQKPNKIWQTLRWKTIGFSIVFEGLYLEIVRKTTGLEGSRHARAAARACGPHGVI